MDVLDFVEKVASDTLKIRYVFRFLDINEGSVQFQGAVRIDLEDTLPKIIGMQGRRLAKIRPVKASWTGEPVRVR